MKISIIMETIKNIYVYLIFSTYSWLVKILLTINLKTALKIIFICKYINNLNCTIALFTKFWLYNGVKFLFCINLSLFLFSFFPMGLYVLTV